MKILFVISSLNGGGAERVLSLLANEFENRNNEVVIITRVKGIAYKLNENIICKSIFNEYSMTNIEKVKFYFKMIKIIKEEKPDIIISFMKGMNRKSILISRFLNIPIIVSEHINYKGGMNLITWIERRWIYKLADAVILLTKYDYNMFYKKFLNNAKVIQNPVSFQPLNKLKKKEKTIVASGNLNRWQHKGFDNLLIIFSEVSKVHPDWKLNIAGEGKEGKEYLIDICKDLNILDKVHFLGFCDNLSDILASSSVFVLSSRFEGFPMVLIEAMSQGCACVSYDCISGPSEIITNNIDGILIEDQNIEKMKQSIIQIIQNEETRERLSIEATKSVGKLSITNIADEWLFLINKIKNIK